MNHVVLYNICWISRGDIVKQVYCLLMLQRYRILGCRKGTENI